MPLTAKETKEFIRLKEKMINMPELKESDLEVIEKRAAAYWDSMLHIYTRANEAFSEYGRELKSLADDNAVLIGEIRRLRLILSENNSSKPQTGEYVDEMGHIIGMNRLGKASHE